LNKLGSTAQYKHNFTELLQHSWALPWENRRIAAPKFGTSRKQTMEPCFAEYAKQVVQSSEQVHRTIKQTFKSAAGTAAQQASNKNYFSTRLQPLPDPQNCRKAV
jgi:hypothetical protein